MRFQERDDRGKRAVAQLRVRVEQEHVRRIRRRERAIAGRGETQVGIVREHLDVTGVTRTDELATAVLRTVIGNDDARETGIRANLVQV